MKGVGFYKYIVKNGASYSIMKNNEKFGTYFKLSDALYERDRLIEADWDWDNLSELPEVDNIYEKMNLPKFQHEYSYIYKVYQSYEIYKDGIYHDKFYSKKEAYEYADSIGGEVIPASVRFQVQKSINGKQIYFGCYRTLEEAKKKRDELIKNRWEYG